MIPQLLSDMNFIAIWMARTRYEMYCIIEIKTSVIAR